MKFSKKDFIDVLPKSVKRLSKDIAGLIPAYFYWVPASSSGKYHPSYALGNGGLARHSMSAYGYLNKLLKHDVAWVFELDGLADTDVEYLHEVLDGVSAWSFAPMEADLLRVAVLFHDGRKSGTAKQYAVSHATKFDHPIQMADAVREIGTAEACYVAEAICSHMGKWTTSKYAPGVELEAPQTDAQKLVHVADYLASRKGLEAGYLD